MGLCPILLELLYGAIPLRSIDPIVLDKIKPVNIESLELTQGKWKYLGEQSSLLRVRASKSLNPSNYIISEKTGSELDWHVIDFSQRGDGKVHYYPFAKAFEHLFTHKRFNDVAEQSRIIGNLLGKLISTISSVGDYLIDESDPKARNVNEVAEMIIDALDNGSYGLFFQHPESATKEDLALLGVILSKLVSKDAVPVAFCEGVAYALQEEFDFTLKQYGIQLGMDSVKFELAFTNLAQSILSEGSIEPTSRVLIEERLISSELEQSSVLAKRAVSQLLESPQVFKNNFGQLQLKSSQFEFVSDEWVSVWASYHADGLLLNKIPLMRKLKWREVASAKAVVGGYDRNNDKMLTRDFNSDGEADIYTLEKPYVEAALGVENIFKLLRVDFVWRLTYLDNPNIAKYGIRAKLHFDF
jgi:hypothetical protein